jgi:tetraacyldisaccharide 4'-kinase
LSLASALYGRAASWRRAWYTRHPERRRRLQCPVISVGNLAVGGRGKTPLVASIARWLVERGERPVVLSRGYARREAVDGVLVVSDRAGVIEPVERSGDEPQMLARALPGVPVLVSPDRYLAGVLAERAFDATVHLLDDGFQYFTLARDIDLLIVNAADLADDVLPSGRLREPLSAMAAASAIIVAGGDIEPVAQTVVVGEASQASPYAMSFRLETSPGAARCVHPFGERFPGSPGRAIAVAGIARPERFFTTARDQGWQIVKEMAFRDHHWFSHADMNAIAAAARDANADTILTTEKDAVRLVPLLETSVPHCRFVFLPITVTVEPRREFFDWLGQRLEAARA